MTEITQTEDSDFDQLMSVLNGERDQFEAYIEGVRVGASGNVDAMNMAEFRDYVVVNWRQYIDGGD